MKSKILAIAALAALPALSQADSFAGIYMGAQYWDMSADGGFGNDDVTQAYNLVDEGKGSVWLAVEHAVPIIPNVKLRYNQMDVYGSADVVDFEFGGVTYDGDTEVDAQLDHLDFIMYYELLDNAVSNLDVGINLKYGDYKVALDGEVTVGDTTYEDSSEEEYTGVIPMVYAATELAIPGSGFSFYGEVNWIGVGDANAYDFQAGAQYLFINNPAVEIGAQLGYRKFKFDVDDVDDLTVDVEFDGITAGLMVHF